MNRRLRALFDSLLFRLLVPLILVVSAVLAVYAAVTFESTRAHIFSLLHEQVDRSSGLIQRATRDDMLLNRKGQVQEMIGRLVGGPTIQRIRIYDKQGTIAFSSDVDEIGHSIALTEPPCLSCHTDEARAGADLATDLLVDTHGGRDHFLHVEAIPNEPACSTQGCHVQPTEAPVLAVLEVQQSIAPLTATLGSARRQLLAMTLALIVVIGAVVALFIRQFVHRPLAQLELATERLAEGHLDTRIVIAGNHELARLGAAFNHMAEDLAAAHAEITSWSQRLEEKVVHKTDELRRAHRQVLQMEKMASLGKLSATVAHELNNPLSGIRTYARLAERELEDQPIERSVRDELQRYLQFISKECGRCGEIAKNLLIFARRSQAEMSAVDVDEILDRSLMLVHHHLELADVRLERSPAIGDCRVWADPGQIQQAVVALLINAIEAMEGTPTAEPCLTVRVEGDEAGVQVHIADNGVGISPETLPHIFEPFFSTKHETSGVGLGLAVVYGIVSRHGGRIDVDSEPGGGTTFHVRLPRRPPERGGEELES